MRPIAFALCAATVLTGTLPAIATDKAASQAVADWEQWRAKENAAWSTDPYAILKIDDAVYLNDGESAWLAPPTRQNPQHKWSLEPVSGALRISHKDGKAEVTHAGKSETFPLGVMQNLNVSAGIDLRFALTQVNPGINGLRVMVYSQDHQAARTFRGLDHFAYDPQALVEATFEPAPSIEGVDFQTSRGWLKRINRAGYASFTLMGKPVRLAMYTGETDPKKVKQLSVFFLDNLSGKETYGVGRYLDVEVNGLPPKLTIDFNRAYNPNCARSPHYNCPYATDKIPVDLRAGEKIPPKH